MKALIKFIGATSSGKSFKYEIIADTAPKLTALQEALKNDGVKMNPNLGVPGFISQTHLYLTPNEGDTFEVDVRGYHDDRTDRDINWFKDIDKIKQKNFAEKQQLTAEVRSIVNVENTLTDLNSSLDVERFERVRLLKLQQKKLAREIDLMGVA